MFDIFVTAVMFIVGWMVGHYLYQILKKMFFGNPEPEQLTIEEEIILKLPRLKLETVAYKEETVYLLNQLPGKFLGQGMSIDEIQKIINKKFPGQQVIIVNESETEGTIVSVPNA